MIRKMISWFVVAVALMLAPSPVFASSVEGVEVPDTVLVGPDSQALKLNGAGLRTKFFFDIYVGALYLPTKATDASSAISMQGPKRVYLHFIYKDLSREKMVNAWMEGFEGNLSEAGFKSLKDRIDMFCAVFKDTKRGETYSFDYIPGKGTEIFHNGESRALIEGEDFMQALLKIWIGEHPAQEKLKAAMLGG